MTCALAGTRRASLHYFLVHFFSRALLVQVGTSFLEGEITNLICHFKVISSGCLVSTPAVYLILKSISVPFFLILCHLSLVINLYPIASLYLYPALNCDFKALQTLAVMMIACYLH